MNDCFWWALGNINAAIEKILTTFEKFNKGLKKMQSTHFITNLLFKLSSVLEDLALKFDNWQNPDDLRKVKRLKTSYPLHDIYLGELLTLLAASNLEEIPFNSLKKGDYFTLSDEMGARTHENSNRIEDGCSIYLATTDAIENKISCEEVVLSFVSGEDRSFYKRMVA